MPLTPSASIALGTKAPPFYLPNPQGHRIGLHDFPEARAVLIAFISNRCPYVQVIREAFAALARDYEPRGLQVIAINANDSDTHPEEAPERIAEESEIFRYAFPYLIDADQSVAKVYGAACTPDLFLYDGNRRLFYHGQFDETRPNNGLAPTGRDLRAAVDHLLAGEAAPQNQTQSIGCNIKWRPGNEPQYALSA
ncbi:thioredoxin family protein [Azospirillum argentinense]|uniref:Thioredoxin family protein n=1 Tax=Azospirillum brasilense TaxID=192 RepID=A0A4D8Q140_AZOBR|nr:thioredoxin family protein [Azospirillum argentinense]QCO00650.1 thioredoxin family protein [Azospirillum argentinense]